jgi:hypothetical protein
MKMTRTILLLLLSAVVAFAEDAKPAAAPPNPTFEKLKALAGSWEGKAPNGDVMVNHWRVIAAGSAVVITVDVPAEDEMLTIIHPDGANVMATHYCTARNQPRYTVVASADPKVIEFQFKDITNATPEAGHMHAGRLTIVDANHILQEWTWRQDGKDTKVGPIEFTRKK